MSGYADLMCFNPDKDAVKEIPCIDATPESVMGLGELVPLNEFDSTKLIYASTLRDTSTGREVIIPKTETTGEFTVWENPKFTYIIQAENKAVNSGIYNVARVDKEDRYKFYFREVNYHPESSQLVSPANADPFILILGHNLRNLKAYVFDGKYGFHIFPGVWHQPPIIHYSGKITFRDKQAATHLCVLYDSVKENNTWLTFSYI